MHEIKDKYCDQMTPLLTCPILCCNESFSWMYWSILQQFIVDSASFLLLPKFIEIYAKSNHNCYLFLYIDFFIVCLHYLFNAHLETKYYKVNIYQIVEDVFECRLHITKIFNRVWIESCLNCCFFVYIHIVCLFVYIFYINKQFVPQA